jgi:hypothetical protein
MFGGTDFPESLRDLQTDCVFLAPRSLALRPEAEVGFVFQLSSPKPSPSVRCFLNFRFRV